MATSMNIQLFQWIHAGAGNRPVMDGLAVFFAEGGPYLLAVLFVALWFFMYKNKKNALLEATEAAIIGLMFNQLVVLFYFHPRPYMVGLCTPLFPHGPETSFPSDHATLMFAAAFYLLTARHWIACSVPLLAVAFLTAWGRIYSGVHFPFDMAGSMVVAMAAALVMHLLSGCFAPLNTRLIQTLEQVLGVLIKRRDA